MNTWSWPVFGLGVMAASGILGFGLMERDDHWWVVALLVYVSGFILVTRGCA